MRSQWQRGQFHVTHLCPVCQHHFWAIFSVSSLGEQIEVHKSCVYVGCWSGQKEWLWARGEGICRVKELKQHQAGGWEWWQPQQKPLQGCEESGTRSHLGRVWNSPWWWSHLRHISCCLFCLWLFPQTLLLYYKMWIDNESVLKYWSKFLIWLIKIYNMCLPPWNSWAVSL